MQFSVLNGPWNVEVIARGQGIREVKRLRREYACKRWRKLKGIAQIRLADGTVVLAELHWYECHGIGKKEIKIKRIIT